MPYIVTLTLVFGFVLAAGCQTGTTESNTPDDTSPVLLSPVPGATKMPSSPPTPADAGLQNLIERTSEDLANRLAISREQISLLEITEVEWSDSSLDCPQPGMDYLQVITPGYRILLQANDQVYVYHSNKDTYFIYCEDRFPPTGTKP